MPHYSSNPWRNAHEPFVSGMVPHVPNRPAHSTARAAGITAQEQTDPQASAISIQWFQDLNASLGIPEKLAGIHQEHIPLMARHAAAESNPLYPVPRLMDATELEQIYYLVKE